MTRHNPWVGSSFGTSSLELARQLSEAYEHELSGDPDVDEDVLRPVVRSSWQRCLSAGVNPERTSTPGHRPSAEVLDRWATHPLNPFTEVVEQMLGSFAYDAGHIVVIADADGCLLWSRGHPRVLAASESIEFTPGRVWTGGNVGTNGVGTALAVDHPIQIFASEHFRRPVHAWVCSGAPVHDPATGRTLGVIDVSSGIRAAHPYSLALVSAAANMVETLLRNQRASRLERLRARFYERVSRAGSGARALVDEHGIVIASHPDGWLRGPLIRLDDGGWLAPGSVDVLSGEPFADGASIIHRGATEDETRRPLQLRGLGREQLLVTLGDAEFELSPRRSELVVLLALAPEGLHAAELVEELYGDTPGDGDQRITVRAEISRLRRQLGGLIATNPYRLVADVDADFLHPERGELDGPLLPGSTSPQICALRDRLERERNSRATL